MNNLNYAELRNLAFKLETSLCRVVHMIEPWRWLPAWQMDGQQSASNDAC